jgi:hypothetical protein
MDSYQQLPSSQVVDSKRPISANAVYSSEGHLPGRSKTKGYDTTGMNIDVPAPRPRSMTAEQFMQRPDRDAAILSASDNKLVVRSKLQRRYREWLDLPR